LDLVGQIGNLRAGCQPALVRLWPTRFAVIQRQKSRLRGRVANPPGMGEIASPTFISWLVAGGFDPAAP